MKRTTPKKPKSDFHEHVGKKLCKLRSDAGLTIRQLSIGTGLSPAFLCDAENGLTMPSFSTICIICDFFGRTPSYFSSEFSGEIEQADRKVDEIRRQTFSALNNVYRNGYEDFVLGKDPETVAVDLARHSEGLEKVPISTLMQHIKDWRDLRPYRSVAAR